MRVAGDLVPQGHLSEQLALGAEAHLGPHLSSLGRPTGRPLGDIIGEANFLGPCHFPRGKSPGACKSKIVVKQRAPNRDQRLGRHLQVAEPGNTIDDGRLSHDDGVDPRVCSLRDRTSGGIGRPLGWCRYLPVIHHADDHVQMSVVHGPEMDDSSSLADAYWVHRQSGSRLRSPVGSSRAS